MGIRKRPIKHGEIVIRFAARLRELRHSRGMTQAELAQAAHVTATYIGRLENAGAAPGIDLVDRLAQALGTTAVDLLPATVSPDTLAVLRERAKRLFDSFMASADRETLLLFNPLIARMIDAR